MTEDLGTNNEPQPWTRISFNIFSDELSPDAISAILDEEPVDSHRKGDLVSSRRPEGPFRPSNYWSVTFDTDTSLPFKIHLGIILDFIEEKVEPLVQLKNRCDMQIFCSSTVLHRCAFDLKLEDIELLQKTKVRIIFDLTADGVL